MTTTYGGTLTIGDRQMRIDDLELVGPEYKTYEANVPDETWTATDENGHLHRYYWPNSSKRGDPELPTLARHVRHIDCDGTGFHPFEAFCEGYDEPYWLCVQCGDEIRPGMRRGTIRVKNREGYYQVTTITELADLVGESGTYTVPSRNTVADNAQLAWPAGPGKVLHLAGRAYEADQRIEYAHGGGQAITVWDFIPNQP